MSVTLGALLLAGVASAWFIAEEPETVTFNDTIAPLGVKPLAKAKDKVQKDGVQLASLSVGSLGEETATDSHIRAQIGGLTDPSMASFATKNPTSGLQFAELDLETGATIGEGGTRVLPRKPSIAPRARIDTELVPRPKLRPSALQEVRLTPSEGIERPLPAPRNLETPQADTAPAVAPTAPASATPVATETAPAPLLPAAETPAAAQTETPAPAAPETAAIDPAPAAEPAPELPQETAAPEALATPDPAVVGKKPKARPQTLREETAEVETPELLPLAYPGHKGKAPKARPSDVVAKVQNDPSRRAYPGHRGKKAKPRPGNLKVARATPSQEQQIATKVQIAEDIAQREAEAKRQAALLARAKELETQNQAAQEAARLKQAIANSSRLAVRVSPLPKRKTSRFTSVVARTKANVKKASLQPAKKKAAPSVTATTKATGKTGSPSKTFRKNRLSLVGVYGTSSARRALMRTSGGRYVKVKRGQRVGGWRVSSIGESSIKITKGSRSQTLRLP